MWADLGANGLSEGELLLASTWPQRDGVLSGLVPPERVAWLAATAEEHRLRRALRRARAHVRRRRRPARALVPADVGDRSRSRSATRRTGGRATCCASARCTGRTSRRSTSAAPTSGSPATWRAPCGRDAQQPRRPAGARRGRPPDRGGRRRRRRGRRRARRGARLVAEGRDVVVLEARDRVGGRLWNTEIGGEANELGGEWIAPYQSRMHALLDELGIELFPAYREGDDVYVDEAGQRAPALGRRARAELRRGARARGGRRQARRAREGARSRRRRGSTRGRASSTRSRSTSGCAPRSATSVARENLRSYLADGFLTKPAHSFSLLQGLWVDRGRGRDVRALRGRAVPRVPRRRRLAAHSDAHGRGARRARRARGAGARRCAGVRRGVEVDAGDVRVEARAAIVAVAPNLAGAIRFEPALPAWRMRLQQASSQGSVTKYLAVYDQPFWREDGLSGEGFAPHRARARALRQHAAVGVGRRALHVPPGRAGRARGAACSPTRGAGARPRGDGGVRRARRRSARRTTSRRTGRRRSGRAARTRRRSASAGSRASAPTCAGRSARSTGRAPTSPASGTCTWRAACAPATRPRPPSSPSSAIASASSAANSPTVEPVWPRARAHGAPEQEPDERDDDREHERQRRERVQRRSRRGAARRVDPHRHGVGRRAGREERADRRSRPSRSRRR